MARKNGDHKNLRDNIPNLKKRKDTHDLEGNLLPPPTKKQKLIPNQSCILNFYSKVVNVNNNNNN